MSRTKDPNAKAIWDAKTRIAEIKTRLERSGSYLERINKSLQEDFLHDSEREKLERNKGRLEDRQQELPAERDDLQSYVDKLLDPEAAWPDEDPQMRRFLCAEERDRIARYCDPVLRAEAMPN